MNSPRSNRETLFSGSRVCYGSWRAVLHGVIYTSPSLLEINTIQLLNTFGVPPQWSEIFIDTLPESWHHSQLLTESLHKGNLGIFHKLSGAILLHYHMFFLNRCQPPPKKKYIYISWVVVVSWLIYWMCPPHSNSGTWRFSSGFPMKNVMSSWWSLESWQGATPNICAIGSINSHEISI